MAKTIRDSAAAVGGLTRRDVLGMAGRATLGAGLLGISALDRLGYAVAARLGDEESRALDWRCEPDEEVWYQCMVDFAKCPGGQGHSCGWGDGSHPFTCPEGATVACNPEPDRAFRCWNPPGEGPPYGCTVRTFECVAEDAGQIEATFICGGSSGGDDPYDFTCDVGDGEFKCGI